MRTTLTAITALAIGAAGTLLPAPWGPAILAAWFGVIAAQLLRRKDRVTAAGFATLAAANIPEIFGITTNLGTLIGLAGLLMVVFGFGKEFGEAKAWARMVALLARGDENFGAVRRARDIAKGRYFRG